LRGTGYGLVSRLPAVFFAEWRSANFGWYSWYIVNSITDYQEFTRNAMKINNFVKLGSYYFNDNISKKNDLTEENTPLYC